MVPAFLLAEFDTFAEERGTDRSEEVRAAYRTHMDDPPAVEDVEVLCEHMDEETDIPRPSAKVMLDADLLREDAQFRDDDEGRGTDRSAEICAAMYRHLEDPPAVAEVTDALHARVRAQTADNFAVEH